MAFGEGGRFVAELHVTCGHQEAAEFATRQREAFEHRDAYMLPVESSVGLGTVPVLLWYRHTTDRKLAITTIRIGVLDEVTTVSGHIKHAGCLGAQALLWNQGASRDLPVSEIVFGDGTREEVDRMRRRGFERVAGSLQGPLVRPGCCLWLRRGHRHSMGPSSLDEASQFVAQVEVEALRGRVDELERLLEAVTPSDRSSKDVMAQAAELRRVRHMLAAREHAQQEHDRLDRLTVASDFLGLEESDVTVLKDVFAGLSKEHGGTAPLEDVCHALGLPFSRLVQAVALFMDRDCHPDRLDGPSFIRTLVTFASLDEASLTHWLFFIAGPNLQTTSDPRRAWQEACSKEDGGRHALEAVYSRDTLEWTGACELRHLQQALPVTAVQRVESLLLAGPERSATSSVSEITFADFARNVLDRPEMLSGALVLQQHLRREIRGTHWWDKHRESMQRARRIAQQRMLATGTGFLSAMDKAALS